MSQKKKTGVIYSKSQALIEEGVFVPLDTGSDGD